MLLLDPTERHRLFKEALHVVVSLALVQTSLADRSWSAIITQLLRALTHHAYGVNRAIRTL